MPWYWWVWGSVSTLACIVLVVVGVAVVMYLLEHRKAEHQIDELQGVNSALERKLYLEQKKTETLSAQLREVRKGQNEFGKISP